MGRLCVICKEEEHPYNNRSFHKFPTDNELRTKWMNAAGLTSISKKTVICNEHFDDNSFHNTAGYTIRRRLLSNAVPNIEICRKQRILQVAHSKNSALRDNSLEFFSCNICSKSFSQSSSLKIHMTVVHRLEPIYKCGYCDKRFDKKSALVLHIKAHGDIQASGNKSTDFSDLTPLTGHSEEGKAKDKLIWAPQSPAVSNTSTTTSTLPTTANVKLLFVTRVPQPQVSSNTSATTSSFTTSTASYQALVVPKLSTIESTPPPPATTSIIKEEVDLEDDDVRDSPELGRDGDQMEYEKELNEEQYDLCDDAKQGNSNTNSDNEVIHQTKSAGLVEPEEQNKASGTHKVSSTQISGVLKRADSLSLDIENILTNKTCNFDDINSTRSTYGRNSTSQPSANTVPTLAYLKTKYSELEEKLRIYYLKTMIKKEAELIDLKIKLNKLQITREEIELSNKRQIHALKVENLELENAKLKLQLQKMTM